jgi:XisI protein
MDKLTEYPIIIKRILTEYVQLCNRRQNQDIETFLIVDELKGHYIWMNLGWQNGDSASAHAGLRITGMTVYVRLLNGKFWIEEDWTENGIAMDLVNAGVDKADIVLAFHEPKMRQYTDFATAS